MGVTAAVAVGRLLSGDVGVSVEGCVLVGDAVVVGSCMIVTSVEYGFF